MTPERFPTVVLLPPMFSGADAEWRVGPSTLTDAGVTVVCLTGDESPHPPYALRWIATTAAALQRETSGSALVLVARGAAGVLVPQLSVAIRARGRRVAGYGFVDAWLPRAGATLGELADVPEDAREEVAPGPADWPDAPCAYAVTDDGFESQARIAGLRAWPAVDGIGRPFTDTLHDVLRSLLPRFGVHT